MSFSPTSLSKGKNVIKRYAEILPGTPGVYRMLDAVGNVLYVGKAKNLKRRVSSYLRVEALSLRYQRMVALTASMEITTTRSEAEALMLEANLVRKFLPRYNILLKDDKSFPYIFFSGHDFSRIAKHRGAKTTKGRYFGPFVSAAAVNDTITLLQKAFLLRPCADTIFKHRTRPCLQYQIKRCSAPCVGKISKEEYAKLVEQAEEFLTGKSRKIQQDLIDEMQDLSLKMNYEKARVVRDRIRALSHVQQQHALTSANVKDADIIALARDGKTCCVQVFSFRGGYNYGNRAWFPKHTGSSSEAEILTAFISQYYQDKPPPPLVLVSHVIPQADVLEKGLRLGTKYKVDVLYPVRGEKHALMLEAGRNAEEALRRHLALEAEQREVLESVQKLFNLEDLPQRIEVYDNSHISGTDAVGAMIACGPEGLMKSEYRRYNIKPEEIARGDDYAMLRQVLTRRFKHLQEEDAKIPDLVLIDGGAGQVSAATAVFEELGVQGIAYAGIAKGPDRNAGREQFFLPGKQPFQLPPDDPALHFLQRLRDEAHRFAIGAHRQKRSKSMQSSELDAIPFIGPGRKKALLLHFGSARAVAAASKEEIANVPGISKSTAQIIFSYFHEE